MLPDELYRRLRLVAAEAEKSMAAVIRDAVEEKLGGTGRPRPMSLGAGESGSRDTARQTVDERPVPRSWR